MAEPRPHSRSPLADALRGQRVRLLLLAGLGGCELDRVVGSGLAIADRLGLWVGATATLAAVFALLHAWRLAWPAWIRPGLRTSMRELVAWSRERLKGLGPTPGVDGGLRLPPGGRVALLFGVMIAALDLLLTALLLRDVFPEPPYQIEAWGTLGQWIFYGIAAGCKTCLTLYLGIAIVLRRASAGAAPSPGLLAAVGGASAFDLLLAVARGQLLAEQGIGGAVATTSNLLFAGFGLAVPWIVAHTGGLVALAVDGVLDRLGLLRILGATWDLLRLALAWVVLTALGLPAAVCCLFVALAAHGWACANRALGLLLGHADTAVAMFWLANPREPWMDGSAAPEGPIGGA